MPIILPVLIAILVLAFASIRIIREYERGVVYTLGKFTGLRQPGLRFVVPVLQQMVIVDMRVRTENVPTQDVVSRDNVSVRVSAVVYYRVVDPGHAINSVEDFIYATSQLAQTTLRSVLGKHELDDMLSKRDQLNADLQELLDHQTEGWGIKVSHVEIKQVDIRGAQEKEVEVAEAQARIVELRQEYLRWRELQNEIFCVDLVKSCLSLMQRTPSSRVQLK